MPPRLTASLNTCRLSSTWNAASRPPLTTKENVAPCAPHWRSITSACACARRGCAQIGNALDGGVSRQPSGDGACVFECLVHSQPQRLERAGQHPAAVDVELIADQIAERAHLLHQRRRSGDRSRHKIAVAADVLGQGVDHKVGSVGEWRLIERSQQGIVDDDQGFDALARLGFAGDGRHQVQIDHRIGRVSRGFHENRGKRAALHRQNSPPRARPRRRLPSKNGTL